MLDKYYINESTNPYFKFVEFPIANQRGDGSKILAT